ncbi:hypothetical protein PsorP6_001667 [Peronosclerospora sorghi]|uniref:Uncharacterized protein n=1 Tax=Peronosclerospora sorghi TaxID=230839 RepID=A0ACC0WU54_9STRA|nr:hypothetical protein PsorP6_001667 [Peronosclerospora sorghi]
MSKLQKKIVYEKEVKHSAVALLKDGLWHLTVKCGEHNYLPALDIAGDAAASPHKLLQVPVQEVHPAVHHYSSSSSDSDTDSD